MPTLAGGIEGNTGINIMTQQHHRITLEDAIARDRNKELTAKGLVRLYFEINLQPGEEVEVYPQDLYHQLGISRSSFYKALNTLTEEKLIEVNRFNFLNLSINTTGEGA
jgi:hypothetical protein